jgi:hypothetical protein
MSEGPATDARSVAFDEYLEQRGSHGFSIETRTNSQAVIVRRRRFFFLLRWFVRDHVEQRFVVSVDEHGEVTSRAAEPRRW